MTISLPTLATEYRALMMFDTLPESSQFATVLAFGLLTGAVALLITPSAYHRIVTKHGAEGRLQHSITWLIDISLLLLGLAIGIDLYLVGDQVLGGLAGPLFGFGHPYLTAQVGLAGLLAAAVALERRRQRLPTHDRGL